MIKYHGKYVVTTSGVEGFDPTETTLVNSDQPTGPYSGKKVISRDHTWQSQITDMIYIPDADYVLLMCDKWFVPDPQNIDKSRYLWLPLEFDPDTGEANLTYRADWNPMRPFADSN